MGDGMALKHKTLGAVGVINGGSIRDVPGISEVGMPVWATGRVPGHGPFNLIETQTEVEVADLIINAGDLLIGDTDGITSIPLDIAEETLLKCKEVRDFETKIFDELKKKL
jgi:regulator of RNase E activity RraA